VEYFCSCAETGEKNVTRGKEATWILEKKPADVTLVVKARDRRQRWGGTSMVKKKKNCTKEARHADLTKVI